MKTTLSIEIKKQRMMYKMSQGKLSELSGVPQSTISDIEMGKTKDPGIFTLMCIADAMGCKLDDIVKRESA